MSGGATKAGKNYSRCDRSPSFLDEFLHRALFHNLKFTIGSIDFETTGRKSTEKVH